MNNSHIIVSFLWFYDLGNWLCREDRGKNKKATGMDGLFPGKVESVIWRSCVTDAWHFGVRATSILQDQSGEEITTNHQTMPSPSTHCEVEFVSVGELQMMFKHTCDQVFAIAWNSLV